MKIAFFFVIIASLAASIAGTDFHPLSDEFIEHINRQNTTWKAARNFDKNISLSYIRGLLGVRRSYEITSATNIPEERENVVIPKSFDARERWAHCKSIKVIKDQGSCSSWAAVAASMMSDRICIQSNGHQQIYVSDEDLISCCHYCGDCSGGNPTDAYRFWEITGIVSGGPYNSTTGCRAYSIPPCTHIQTNGNKPPCSETYITPKCKKQCDDPSTNFVHDKTYSSGWKFIEGEEAMQSQIMKYGPIVIILNVYSDFLSYKSGVYQHVSDDYIGDHALRLLGWGVENKVPYWLAANSWNNEWGHKGTIKILRGQNECNIEDITVIAMPKL